MKLRQLKKILEKYPENIEVKLRNIDRGEFDTDFISVFAVSHFMDFPDLVLCAEKELYKDEKINDPNINIYDYCKSCGLNFKEKKAEPFCEECLKIHCKVSEFYKN